MRERELSTATQKKKRVCGRRVETAQCVYVVYLLLWKLDLRACALIKPLTHTRTCTCMHAHARMPGAQTAPAYVRQKLQLPSWLQSQTPPKSHWKSWKGKYPAPCVTATTTGPSCYRATTTTARPASRRWPPTRGESRSSVRSAGGPLLYRRAAWRSWTVLSSSRG